jgi:hypothetical protein
MTGKFSLIIIAFYVLKELVYSSSKIMFEHYEKKLNKILLDFIIGGSYMGDQGHNIAESVKRFVVDIYEHLLEQWELFKKWYRD